MMLREWGVATRRSWRHPRAGETRGGAQEDKGQAGNSLWWHRPGLRAGAGVVDASDTETPAQARPRVPVSLLP